MSRPPYRALSLGLRVVSALIAVGGVFMILSGKPLILRVFMHPPESEVSTLLLALLKEMGGVMLMLSLMMFLAARDPARNVAIVDALIVGLCTLAITPLLSLKMLDLGSVFDLGPITGQAGVGGGSVLRAPSGFASHSPIMTECRVQIS